MTDEFAGQVAVVTGGASGIGLSTASELHRRGAHVIVLDRDVTGALAEFESYAADVTDDTVDEAFKAIDQAHGRVDVLVNNAGVGSVGTVADNDLDEWRQVYEVNVFGLVRVTRSALPLLRRSASASIVNTCSVAANLGLRDRALYTSTKGAVLALTRAMAADHLADGIRVNCVAPGTVDTPWVSRLLDAATDPEASRAALLARQPTGRLVSPEEVAAAIAYLASPLAASTTGTCLPVDGGMHSLLAQTR
jgi:2-keto-3-deoxy-L-fuconate dehydrogenase